MTTRSNSSHYLREMFDLIRMQQSLYRSGSVNDIKVAKLLALDWYEAKVNYEYETWLRKYNWQKLINK